MAAPDYCALLAKAEAAYDDYLTGKTVVEFQDQNRERVKYSEINIGRLEARIKELRGLCTPSKKIVSKPIGFLF